MHNSNDLAETLLVTEHTAALEALSENDKALAAALESMDELESDDDDFNGLEAIGAVLLAQGGVSKENAATIHAMCPSLEKRCPLNSYTNIPSKTNYEATLEAINWRMVAKGAVIAAGVGIAILTIYSLLKERGGTVERLTKTHDSIEKATDKHVATLEKNIAAAEEERAKNQTYNDNLDALKRTTPTLAELEQITVLNSTEAELYGDRKLFASYLLKDLLEHRSKRSVDSVIDMYAFFSETVAVNIVELAATTMTRLNVIMGAIVDAVIVMGTGASTDANVRSGQYGTFRATMDLLQGESEALVAKLEYNDKSPARNFVNGFGHILDIEEGTHKHASIISAVTSAMEERIRRPLSIEELHLALPAVPGVSLFEALNEKLVKTDTFHIWASHHLMERLEKPMETLNKDAAKYDVYKKDLGEGLAAHPALRQVYGFKKLIKEFDQKFETAQRPLMTARGKSFKLEEIHETLSGTGAAYVSAKQCSEGTATIVKGLAGISKVELLLTNFRFELLHVKPTAALVKAKALLAEMGESGLPGASKEIDSLRSAVKKTEALLKKTKRLKPAPV